MPRDGSNVYRRPPGTDGIPNTTIESAKYNVWVGDVEQDLNLPRPIVAGGTGGTSAHDALVNLGAEKAEQLVDNFDTFPFVSGSWSSLTSATNPPVAGMTFSGTAVINADDDDWAFLEARQHTDNSKWFRAKAAGVWSAWTKDTELAGVSGSTGIASATADMFFGLTGTAPNSYFSVNTESDKSGTDALKVNKDGSAAFTAPLTVNSAGSALQIGGNGGAGLFGDGASIGIRAFGDGNIYLQNAAHSSTYAVFWNAGATIYKPTYIDATLGVAGTLSAGADANVTGTATAGTLRTAAGIQFGGSAGIGYYSDGTNVSIRSYSNGSVFFQDAGGSQTYGYFHGAGYDFFVSAGNCAKPGGGTWVNSTSDARAKDVLGEYELGLEELKTLRPVKYRYKGNDTPGPGEPSPNERPARDGTVFVGLVAQEAETAFPDIVSKVAGYIDGAQVSDLRRMDASELIYALINATRTLAARVEALEAQAAQP